MKYSNRSYYGVIRYMKPRCYTIPALPWSGRSGRVVGVQSSLALRVIVIRFRRLVIRLRRLVDWCLLV
eukprot:16001437-Heterocapsa_arctica.AAC.1